MSEDFTRIGIRVGDLRPLQQNIQVTSVRAGADLHILGEMKEPLVMKLKHTGKTYITRPAVIRGMHSAFNLSGPWLKMMGWDDLHSQGCLMMDRQPVPLVHHAATGQTGVRHQQGHHSPEDRPGSESRGPRHQGPADDTLARLHQAQ